MTYSKAALLQFLRSFIEGVEKDHKDDEIFDAIVIYAGQTDATDSFGHLTVKGSTLRLAGFTRVLAAGLERAANREGERPTAADFVGKAAT